MKEKYSFVFHLAEITGGYNNFICEVCGALIKSLPYLLPVDVATCLALYFDMLYCLCRFMHLLGDIYTT